MLSSYSTEESTLTSSTPEAWLASLELVVGPKDERSVIKRSRQNGPLTIQSPFYPEGDICHIYLLHPPGGIVGGDVLRLHVTVEENGHSLITTPGATKYYTSNEKVANQTQSFTVENNAACEWLPQETIFFPNSRSVQKTILHLQEKSRFIGWEINCFGLPVNERNFEDGSAHLHFSVYLNSAPVLLDSLKVSAQKKQAAFLRNQPVNGTLISTGGCQKLIDLLRQNIEPAQRGVWGVTLVEQLLILRYLGPSTLEARKIFCSAWKLLRPEVIQREPTLPRIWAT